MTLEGTGGCKLAELVTDHILSDVNRNVLLAVVNGDGVTHEIREDRGGTGPGLKNLLLVLLVHSADASEELLFDVITFFQTSTHYSLPPYFAFLRLTMNLSVLAFLLRVL